MSVYYITELHQSRLNSGPKNVTLHKPTGFKLMTRDRWESHCKEIFLHKASVAHGHLKPMDFQLVVFGQSNLQEKNALYSTSHHTNLCEHPYAIRTAELTNSCLAPKHGMKTKTATAKSHRITCYSSKRFSKRRSSLLPLLLFCTQSSSAPYCSTHSQISN